MPPNSVGYLVHPWLRHMKLRCEERHPALQNGGERCGGRTGGELEPGAGCSPAGCRHLEVATRLYYFAP
jgi:hypothetical protein